MAKESEKESKGRANVSKRRGSEARTGRGRMGGEDGKRLGEEASSRESEEITRWEMWVSEGNGIVKEGLG